VLPGAGLAGRHPGAWDAAGCGPPALPLAPLRCWAAGWKLEKGTVNDKGSVPY